MEAPKEVRAYVSGNPIVLHEALGNSDSVVLEVELEDGRTVQLVVSGDGRVDLRAWGNVPAKLGNDYLTSFDAVIPFQRQTHDPITYERLKETDEA